MRILIEKIEKPEEVAFYEDNRKTLYKEISSNLKYVMGFKVMDQSAAVREHVDAELQKITITLGKLVDYIS